MEQHSIYIDSKIDQTFFFPRWIESRFSSWTEEEALFDFSFEQRAERKDERGEGRQAKQHAPAAAEPLEEKGMEFYRELG